MRSDRIVKYFDYDVKFDNNLKYQLEWRENAGKGGVYNYEIGIDSTPNSVSPSILPFTSTEHNPNFQISANTLPVGTVFYFTIKTITKANKESIQVWNIHIICQDTI